MDNSLKSGLLLILVAMLMACHSSDGPEYYAPEWAEGIVWYQIFPERFRDGDPHNQPSAERARGPKDWHPTSWTQDWYARDDWELNKSDDFYGSVFERRYGGDLQGVIDQLDYLKDLGVGGIYFNPVFDAQSLHKYDASYYHHIDRNFGPDPEGDVALFTGENPGDPSTWRWSAGDSLFLKLIQEAHARDIRVVIDGVWNHTGTEFWAFRDLVENQEQSSYKDWYIVSEFDDPETEKNEFDYEGWWGFKGLPVFREENEGLTDPVRDHIFAVTKRWMDPNGDGDTEDGVDGWRLDVAQEVGDRFWKEWHSLVRDINPEAITIAEIWTDEAKDYINGEMFTSVMNYRFAYAAKDYFIDQSIDIEEFNQRLTQIERDYPRGSYHVLQNLMDSHDTPRLGSMIVNPGRKYDREAYPRDGYSVRKPDKNERAVQKLVAVFQYTWKGAPMIYYGTEAGMWGADDPDDRKPMVWQEMDYETENHHPYGEERPSDPNVFDTELHNFYQSLAELRNEYPALQKGEAEFVVLDGETGLVVFKRSLDGHPEIYVALNRSTEHQDLTIKGCTFENLLNGEVKENQSIMIEPVTGAVFEGLCE